MLQSEWLSDPEFSLWLSGVPGDEVAFCKLCNKQFGVFNGKSSLRSHANGIKHNQLLHENVYYQRTVIPPTRKSSNSTKPCHKKESLVSGINFCLINAPYSAGLPGVHQFISDSRQGQSVRQPSSVANHHTSNSSRECVSAHRSAVDRTTGLIRDLYSDFDTFSNSKIKSEPHENISRERPNQSSSVFSRGPTSSQNIDRSENTSRNLFPNLDAHSSQVKYEKKSSRELLEKIEQMLLQHDVVIESDCLDFLEIYKEFLRNTGISSSSQFDLYSSIKDILKDYESQQKNLRKKIRRRLLEVLNE